MMNSFLPQSFLKKAMTSYRPLKVFIFLLSLSVAFSVWVVSKNYYENRAQEHYEEYVNLSIMGMHERFSAYANLLRSGIGFLDGNEKIDHTSWYNFVNALELKKYYPGMQGLGFSVMISPNEIADLEQKMRKEGFSSFSIKPVGKRAQYSSIIYLEPMNKRNVEALGYDMFAEPTRRRAMERARDTGLPSISKRVKLLQEIGTEVQPGILMYIPFYKKGMKTDTLEARRKALVGYVYSPFRMYDLIDAIGIKNENINFKIYDGLNHDDAHLLYQSSKDMSYASKHSTHRTIELAGVIFEIDFTSTRKFDEEMNSLYPLFFTSVVFSILLGIIIILVKGRYRLEYQKKELKVNELWLETILSSSIDGIHVLDFEGNLIEWSPSFIEMLGYSEEEAHGLNVLDWDAIHSSDEISGIMLALSDKDHITLETRQRRKDGTILDVEIMAKKIMLDGRDYIYASARDITERKKANNEVLKLLQALEQSPNTVVITDLDANIEYVNNAFEVATGYTKAEAIGKNPRFFQSGKTVPSYYIEMWKNLLNGELWRGEFINQRKDGTEYIESVRASVILDTEGMPTHYMAIKEDITDSKIAEDRLNYLARYDLLTGLPNRSQLEESIEYAIKLGKRNNGNFAVVFLDIDHFKNINDTLGHRIGDILLIEVAKRLKGLVREVDCVGRLGGDEFIFILQDTDAIGVVHVIQKMLDTISEPLKIDENELTVTASAGIAIYPFDGLDQETLYKNADVAMYSAKEKGRNNYAYFTSEMQNSAARNLQLMSSLHHALEKDQLRVVYQPQISALDGRIIGAEALLRWKHPTLGDISPVEFITLAEDSGLILPIGEWVLRTAIQQAKDWIDSGLEPMIIAVNISAVQFRHPDLPKLVTKILNEVGLSANYLEIELTEAVAMNDPESAYAVMDDLDNRGVRMSIDDFGTGYSSLSYLKKFKVYKLKIDQSFVYEITSNNEDKAIVDAIISMSHSLGLITIAEGVETLEQLEYLQKQGCDEIQGYYYSKPLSPQKFDLFVRDRMQVK